MTVANIRGIAVGKWIKNIGGIGSALAVVLRRCGGAAVVAAGRDRDPATGGGHGCGDGRRDSA